MSENKVKKLDSEEKQGSQCRGRSVCAGSRGGEAEAVRSRMDVHSRGEDSEQRP